MNVKAVVLCAGKGARLCPLTPFLPKEMLPIGGLPAIHHVLFELKKAGIKQVMIVLSQGKESVRAYCSDRICPKGEVASALADQRESLLSGMQILFAEQKQLLGTADAVYLARDFMGKDPLLVVYPDDLLALSGSMEESRATSRLLTLGEQSGKSVVLCEEIPARLASQYGVLRLRPHSERGVADVLDLEEKPIAYPYNGAYALVGRMLLLPEVVESIASYPLNDGEGIIPMLKQAAKRRKLFASVLNGKRYDVGSHHGYQEVLKRAIGDGRY